MPNTFTRPRGRRFTTVDRVNLSEHVLKIKLRKKAHDFNFEEIEDYVQAVAGGRQFQYEAIRDVMTYLWGGGYKDLADLAKENYKNNPHLQERFGSEELYLGHLPLPDRLSGVVHMATGTGKSWIIFAVAYLSLIMGFTKRVLVLGPSSTIIEEGLRDKFESFLGQADWNNLLPREYQGKAIELLKDNDAIEDNSITIENINAIYREGGINDTLFKDVDEVLVLGDEIHHAYSHLNFDATRKDLEMDQEVDPKVGQETDEKAERLWMQFLRKHKEITRHIGFTGTPYNKDDYFADIIHDYNIRVAIDEKYIKDINPIIGTESDQGDVVWTHDKRFAVIYKNHLDNSEKYSYTKNGVRRVKPITVFYCPTINNAESNKEDFIQFLIKREKEELHSNLTTAELDYKIRPKVLCVVSGISKEDKERLIHVEETDPNKVGGAVEFIFSVGKLLEGWDVDNVFQIVPMEERIFNSKLLISQVLGRGLRIPRCLDKNIGFDAAQLKENYPMLTVTNHEKFADKIKEILYAVINTDMFIISEPLEVKDDPEWRGKYHFSLFNLHYLSGEKFEDAPSESEQMQNRQLILEKFDLKENLTIFFDKGKKEYRLKKQTITLDSIVDSLFRRFKGREYEEIRFDFGNGEETRCPTEDEIRNVILAAMEKAEISKDNLADENKKQIDLYFNQFLPKGTKIRIPINVTGNIFGISTQKIDKSSVRVGELERDATAFMSGNYLQEIDEKTKALIKYIEEDRKRQNIEGQQRLWDMDSNNLLIKFQKNIKPLIIGDSRPPYIVKNASFKTPQSVILVSYYPEKEFVFRLIENNSYLDSWIKSPDKGFYSIEYEYWKGGKDRVLRSFNPDFFIKINLDNYIKILKENGERSNLENIIELQEKGIESIIKVVEIKSDEDEDEATPAKAEKAKIHFAALNKKLSETNPINFTNEFKSSLKQFYTFDLLKPEGFASWFTKLKNGDLK
jgi:type III restriction enzyme